MKDLFIYIVTNERRTTLYIGVTNDLQSRVWQHSRGEGSGFTRRYNLAVLIYYEVYPTRHHRAGEAIERLDSREEGGAHRDHQPGMA